MLWTVLSKRTIIPQGVIYYKKKQIKMAAKVKCSGEDLHAFRSCPTETMATAIERSSTDFSEVSQVYVRLQACNLLSTFLNYD